MKQWAFHAVLGQFSSAALVALLASRAVAEIPNYGLTALGDLDGRGSYARSVNNSGVIVGESRVGDTGSTHAFVYAMGAMSDLGTLGGHGSVAYDINDGGDVVGYAYTDMITNHAFLYRNGIMQDLGTLGGPGSIAYGINASGDVVGDAHTDHILGVSAFLYTSGQMANLGRFGGIHSTAVAINASGVVTGEYDLHAFVYANSVKTDLGTFGGTESVPYDINDNGDVVGYAHTTGNVRAHAFLYSGGFLYDLGTLPGDLHSAALGINNKGQIVGAGEYGSGTGGRGFLYDSGTMHNLNDLISTSDPLRPYVKIFSAVEINESGQIAANGVDSRNGKSYGYLLTRLPPDTTANPPTVAAVAGDSCINTAEVQSGVSITGGGEPEATVTLNFSSLPKSGLVSKFGAWSISFSSTDLGGLPDGNLLLSAHQTDRAGNLSAVTTVTVCKDTVPPPAPSIDPVTKDNVVKPNERMKGLKVSGKVAAGVSVAVTVGQFSNAATGNKRGAWSIDLTKEEAAELPIGDVRVTATTRDAAGNTSEAVSYFRNL